MSNNVCFSYLIREAGTMARTNTVAIRLSDEELRAWRVGAAFYFMPLAQYVRGVMEGRLYNLQGLWRDAKSYLTPDQEQTIDWSDPFDIAELDRAYELGEPHRRELEREIEEEDRAFKLEEEATAAA